jgi:3-hydroxybutyryl-CoA dehydrogenase
MTVPDDLRTVAVIGNGNVGHGVAQVFATAEIPVVMIGRSEESLADAMDRIDRSLAQFEDRGLVTPEARRAALDRIRTSTEMTDAADAEFVFEAVPADPEVQTEVYEQLDEICPPSTVIGSGSGQPVGELDDPVTHRERLVATHFWYPPQQIPLVEVCAGPETDEDVVPWVCDVLESVGKEPVVIEEEIPGFIGNRLQFALLREAWALWASGVASAEAIDAVTRLSIGRRLAITGPIESADLAGLETMHSFAEFLQPDLNTDPKPPDAVGDVVEAGHDGPSTGRGIYDWSDRDADTLLDEREAELFRHLEREEER